MNLRSAAGAVALLAVFGGAPAAFPADLQPGKELPVPAGVGPDSRFGAALAVGQDVVAVGAYLSGAGGAVYLFHHCADGSWPLGMTLVGGAGEWFGFDVAIEGNHLLVGAPRAQDAASGAQTGAAYRFDLPDFNIIACDKEALPALRTRLLFPSGREGDEIGSAVAMAGNIWAVGARGVGQAGTGAGSVYVFSGGEFDTKLTPEQPTPGAGFGQSVSLDGSLLAVGAPFAEVGGAASGAAYLFDGGSGWQRTRLPATVRPDDAFGYAVAVSGDEVVVGAPLDASRGTDAGAAYLYRHGERGWQQVALPLDAGEAAAGAQFGVAVAFDRRAPHEIVTGARRAGRDHSGAAYRFSSAGSAIGKLTAPCPPNGAAPCPQPGAEFGFSAAIHDGTVVIGAFLHDRGRGAAFLFAPQAVPTQAVTVQFAADKTTVRESDGMVRLPVVVATSDGQPTAATITLPIVAPAKSGSHFHVTKNPLTIPARWHPEVQFDDLRLTIVQDPLRGDETFSVGLGTPVGATLGKPSVEVITMIDDDPAGLTITLARPPRLVTDDDGAADQFTIALMSQPNAFSTVRVDFFGATGQGVLSPPSLVFTPATWNQPQTVKVSGVEGAGCAGDVRYSIAVTTSSTDSRYAALSQPAAPAYSVRVLNRHRDRTHIAASLTACARDDGIVVYTLVLANDGECDLEEVPGNQLTDVLPLQDLSLVMAAADRGSTTVDLAANRVSWSGPIPMGERAAITIVAAVLENVPLGRQVSNQAMLVYASHPGGPADTTVYSNDPALPGPTNHRVAAPTVFIVGGASLRGLGFYTVAPCRVLDTRPDKQGPGPALSSGTARTITIGGLCGIPPQAKAVSLNITVTEPSDAGFLTFYPDEGPALTPDLIHFAPQQTRAESAILPLGCAGQGTLQVSPSVANSGTVHLIIDVNGWFQ
ncbi:MAG TPA: hypothetical protein VHQ90_15670 [Thermoanaerobaculia bacterium]|nr:hypothetical protein [Thermoanaerobaculia bacterium]